MAIKIFLDTNILLDFFDSERPSHEHSYEIIKAIESGNIKGFTSESVFTSLDYILHKISTPQKRLEIFSDLNTILHILPCSNIIIHRSINSRPPDFEDAVLYQIALEFKMHYFITNDLGYKKISNPLLPVFKPVELIRKMN